MKAVFVKALFFEILPLLVAVSVGLYLLSHPPGKPIVRGQLPTIQEIEFPPVTLKKEKPLLTSMPLRNPFLPSTYAMRIKRTAPQKEGGHILTMVLLGKGKSCIIDNKMVKEGELVTKGFRVIRILENGVWVEENGRKVFIALSPYR